MIRRRHLPIGQRLRFIAAVAITTILVAAAAPQQAAAHSSAKA